MSEAIFDRVVKKAPQFRLSTRFDVKSVIHEGVHYFLDDSQLLENGTVSVQAVFRRGKWRQDTRYIPCWLFNAMLTYRAERLDRM